MARRDGRTDWLTTKRCSISPPPFTYWYWVEQISFTQSFRLTALDPYGDQNNVSLTGHYGCLSHRPDPRALLLTSRFCIRDVWHAGVQTVGVGNHKTASRQHRAPSVWILTLWKGPSTRCLFKFKQMVHCTRDSSASSRFKPYFYEKCGAPSWHIRKPILSLFDKI